ncbi:hypothetical protein EPR50_G00031660 [Perca flavescens]|uniref:Uncharacterized protein n=1 Tax=Perca flavescens TaxID=8167 RepID=A0A484DIX0_PERFV|nr:hypothetical protein EPR50_G00031660 [Perca flavescens]
MDGEEEDFMSGSHSDDGGGTPVQDEHPASDGEDEARSDPGHQSEDEGSNDGEAPRATAASGDDSDSEDEAPPRRRSASDKSDSEAEAPRRADSDAESGSSPVKRRMSASDDEDGSSPVKRRGSDGEDGPASPAAKRTGSGSDMEGEEGGEAQSGRRQRLGERGRQAGAGVSRPPVRPRRQ